MKSLFESINDSFKRLSENIDERFEMISTKLVNDRDGFKTDYTLWYDGDEDNYFTIFGDRDIYDPRMSSHDMDFGESLEEAENWFYEYKGFEDEYEPMNEAMPKSDESKYIFKKLLDVFEKDSHIDMAFDNIADLQIVTNAKEYGGGDYLTITVYSPSQNVSYEEEAITSFIEHTRFNGHIDIRSEKDDDGLTRIDVIGVDYKGADMRESLKGDSNKPVTKTEYDGAKIVLKRSINQKAKDWVEQEIEKLLANDSARNKSLKEDHNAYEYKGHTIVNDSKNGEWFIKGNKIKFPTDKEAEEYIDDLGKEESLRRNSYKSLKEDTNKNEDYKFIDTYEWSNGNKYTTFKVDTFYSSFMPEIYGEIYYNTDYDKSYSVSIYDLDKDETIGVIEEKDGFKSLKEARKYVEQRVQEQIEKSIKEYT